MGFYDQYELLKLVRDDGVKTFQAREKTANQPVTIHLFSNPAAPYQSELLRKVGKLPHSDSARILDRGSHLGAVYLVTDALAEHGGLLEWITAATKAASRKADQQAGRLFEKPPAMSPSTADGAAPPHERAGAEGRSTTLPLSAVTEPSGQSRLNKEFAELFSTGERPLFSAPQAGAVDAQTGAPGVTSMTAGMSRTPVGGQPAVRAEARVSPVRSRSTAADAPASMAPTTPLPVPPPLPKSQTTVPLAPLLTGVAVIAILFALFLLFFARRAHYL